MSKMNPSGGRLGVWVALLLSALVVALILVFGGRIWSPSDTPAPELDTTRIEPVPSEPVAVDIDPIVPREREVSAEALFADFREPFNPDIWRPSTHLNELPSSHYGGPWMRENIEQLENRMALLVRAGIDGARPTMAELKTKKKYGYGRYEVIMQPSGEQGTVSAFFTYTGPWGGDPHDEVDIEFTGRAPRRVEFNYFKNGRSGAHKKVKLDFDTSKSMNLYAFDWRADEIVWYVNGQELYRTPAERTDIPTHPGQLFISAWTGKKAMEVWTGAPKFGDSAQSEYACISYTPVGDPSYRCADLWAEDPQFADQDRP
jgi:beta-glucanase (GH16 family)